MTVDPRSTLTGFYFSNFACTSSRSIGTHSRGPFKLFAAISDIVGRVIISLSSYTFGISANITSENVGSFGLVSTLTNVLCFRKSYFFPLKIENVPDTKDDAAAVETFSQRYLK